MEILKAIAYLDYWIGPLVADILPGLGIGEEAEVIHEYFEKIADCLGLIMMSEILTASTVSSVKNRVIYRDLASFPTPKVELGSVHEYKLSWRRLQSSAVDSEAREVTFLLITQQVASPRVYKSTIGSHQTSKPQHSLSLGLGTPNYNANKSAKTINGNQDTRQRVEDDETAVLCSGWSSQPLLVL